MTITIARARPDRPEIAALIGELDAYLGALYPTESNHLLSAEQLLAANVRFLAAMRGDEIVGIGAVVIHRDYGEIKRVYVRPAARGQGVAQRLLAALIEQARAAGLSILRLETGIHQPAALSLFRASGFRDIGPFADYQADPLSVFMERAI